MSDERERLQLRPAASFGQFTAAFLLARKIRRVQVPASFPSGLAFDLVKSGIRVEPVKGHFWPQRELKSEAELKQMRAALELTELGMARGIEVLRAAKPAKAASSKSAKSAKTQPGTKAKPGAKRSPRTTGGAGTGTKRPLLWGGAPLTSEALRAEIDTAILRAGGLPANTIVAGGLQACDPHERGSGQLFADDLIILDIFPRHVKTGYYGDMTRTVVRGRASEAQRHLWETVLAGQKMALRAMKPGVDGGKVHKEIKAFFAREGYPTEQRDGRWRGFFHGTGHGLGLEIHEEPRFGRTIFQPGQVITVEPGLYWPEIGGVRIEDVAAVTATGNRLISRFPKELEI